MINYPRSIINVLPDEEAANKGEDRSPRRGVQSARNKNKHLKITLTYNQAFSWLIQILHFSLSRLTSDQRVSVFPENKTKFMKPKQTLIWNLAKIFFIRLCLRFNVRTGDIQKKITQVLFKQRFYLRFNLVLQKK